MIREVPSPLADASDLVGRQAVLPVPDVCLAVALELMNLAVGFAGILRVRMLCDGLAHRVGEGEPQELKDLLELHHRPQRQVLMPAEVPIGMALLVATNNVMENAPVEDCVFNDVRRPVTKALEFHLKWRKNVAHQYFLAQQVVRWNGPIQTLEAACKRRRMTEEYDDVGLVLGCQPFHRH